MEFLERLSNVAVLVFVVACMAAAGLGLGIRDIVGPLRRGRLVVVAVIANFVVAPALAWGLTAVFPLERSYENGLLLLGGAAGAPFLPKLAEAARGDLAFSVGLMLLLMVGSVVVMPLLLPVLIPGLSAEPWPLLKPLLVTMLLPLAVGIAVRAGSERWANRLRPTVRLVSNIAMLLAVVLLIGLNTTALLGTFGTWGGRGRGLRVRGRLTRRRVRAHRRAVPRNPVGSRLGDRPEECCGGTAPRDAEFPGRTRGGSDAPHSHSRRTGRATRGPRAKVRPRSEGRVGRRPSADRGQRGHCGKEPMTRSTGELRGGVLVTDFDGTMTRHDFYRLAIASLVPADTPNYWADYRTGRITHFEALRRYFATIRLSEADVLKVVDGMELDSGLPAALADLRRAGWAVVVVSAGCEWYIRRLIAAAGVEIEVHANPGRYVPGAGLVMEMPAGSPYLSHNLGIDKERVVRKFLEEGRTVAFAGTGDGFPDADPARLVPGDLRYAKGDLADVLDREGLPYRPFDVWSDVARGVLGPGG